MRCRSFLPDLPDPNDTTATFLVPTMITVDRLEKRYGAVTALAGISFEVPTGQVLGFLGPNGAGKSTTMKILTGFLMPDGGTAHMGDLDVVEDTLEVRRRIGYLPETTPLYAEMRVDDYLSFVADIRGVPAGEKKQKTARAVDACGLGNVLKKGIGELSKGFRQRVGLAQAIVHDPEVMILDEPTSGLDPNQIVEIRELIKHLGTERTVILSTHYLQEVEATCNRILIIANGSIVADGTVQSLTASEEGGPLSVRIHPGEKGTREKVRGQLTELLGADRVQERGDSNGIASFDLRVRAGQNVEEAVFDLVARNGWRLVAMHRTPATLETVFRRKTMGGARA